ncbi:MAG: 4-hydroxy-tetrahydrodipicolinate reductase [Elusimicrobia bacterium]|nr:4-hydroxy-tetrahydrodipicolinate reductase [Elusimicrobiota bacterium]
MKRIRLTVCGCRGRMGKRVVALARKDPRFILEGQIDRHNQTRLAEALRHSSCVIDFTSPESSLRHALAAAGSRVAIVIGTTGLSPSSMKTIAGLRRKIPVFYSPNMSWGMNLLFEAAGRFQAPMAVYQKKIVETHHRGKKDAPSGTALRLARLLGGPVSIASRRVGRVIGEHKLILNGRDEHIEWTHKALSRDAFARGALEAAAWLVQRRPGFYGFPDLLK